MVFFIKALLALAACQSVRAHFELVYPATRGFDEDIEDRFCGGFPQVSTTRSPFPLGSAPIVIENGHEAAQVAVQISTSANPTSFADFNSTSTNGTVVQYLLPFFSITGEGNKCFNVDVSSLNVAGLADGANATISIAYSGGDGSLYQCSDITLSASAQVPANITQICGAASAAPSASGAGQTSPSASMSAPAQTSARSGASTLVVSTLAIAVAGLAVATLS